MICLRELTPCYYRFLTGVCSAVQNVVQHCILIQVETICDFSQTIWTTEFWLNKQHFVFIEV
jgi:hypothetical protein